MEIIRGDHIIKIDNDHAHILDEWYVWVRKDETRFYAQCEHKKLFRMRRTLHKLIVDAPENMVVDHINGDGLDNRKSNLRVCSTSQNAMNRRVRSDSSTGIKGVTFDSRRTTGRLYRAQIKVDGKRIHLGSFFTADEARVAYFDASKKYHGEFGRTE